MHRQDPMNAHGSSASTHSNESCPLIHSLHTQPRRVAQRWVGVLGTAAGTVVGGFAGASKTSSDWPAPLRLMFALTSTCLGAFASELPLRKRVCCCLAQYEAANLYVPGVYAEEVWPHPSF